MNIFETLVTLIYRWHKKLEGDTNDKINWFALLLGFFILGSFISLNIHTFFKSSFPLVLLFTLIALIILRQVVHGLIDIEEITTIKKVKRTNLIITLFYCLLSVIAYLFKSYIQDLMNL